MIEMLFFCVDISLVESLLSMLNNIGSNLNIARSTEQLSKVSLHIIKVSFLENQGLSTY